MNYSILRRFQWIRVEANNLEIMPRKTEEKKIVLVHVDMALILLHNDPNEGVYHVSKEWIGTFLKITFFFFSNNIFIGFFT